MATILNYNFATAELKDDVLVAGFADQQFGAKEYLLFQNWAETTDEDAEIYLERDEQSQGTYGGIERLILFRTHAILLLSAQTAKTIDTEQEVNIRFSATDEQFQKLKAGLQTVFAGKTSFEAQQ